MRSKKSAVRTSYEWTLENFTDALDINYKTSSSNFFCDATWKITLFKKFSYPAGPVIAMLLQKISETDKPLLVSYKIFMGDKIQCVHNTKLFTNIDDGDEIIICSHSDLARNKILKNGALTIICEMDAFRDEIKDTGSNNTINGGKRKDDYLYNASTELKASGICKLINTPCDVPSMNNLAAKAISGNDKACNTTSNFELDRSSCSNSNSASPKQASEFKTCNVDNVDKRCSNCKKSLSSMAGTGTEESTDHKSLNNLSLDLKSMYLNSEFSDVVLVGENFTIPAHKAVLSSRSSYFMEACTKNKLEIRVPELDEMCLKEVLYYIYTGKIKKLCIDSAARLMRSANLLKLDALKLWMTDYLRSGITVENVVVVIEKADVLKNIELKRLCFKFISERLSDVLETDNWLQMSKCNPRLVGEILLTVASIKKTNI